MGSLTVIGKVPWSDAQDGPDLSDMCCKHLSPNPTQSDKRFGLSTISVHSAQTWKMEAISHFLQAADFISVFTACISKFCHHLIIFSWTQMRHTKVWAASANRLVTNGSTS